MGQHPHYLSEAVGLSLPGGAKGSTKTLGIIFGGCYNSGMGQGGQSPKTDDEIREARGER